MRSNVINFANFRKEAPVPKETNFPGGGVPDYELEGPGEVAYVETEDGQDDWFPIYVCDCNSPYFFVTPQGCKCSDPNCGKYINFDLET